MTDQLVFDLRPSYVDLTAAATWSPRDIWNNLTADLIATFREDRRVEHKVASMLWDTGYGRIGLRPTVCS